LEKPIEKIKLEDAAKIVDTDSQSHHLRNDKMINTNTTRYLLKVNFHQDWKCFASDSMDVLREYNKYEPNYMLWGKKVEYALVNESGASEQGAGN
jgi:hypothetical protein